MQRNGSDLLGGLPWQSIMTADGRPQHEPLRLTTVVQAPVRRVDACVRRNPILQRLFHHGWVALAVVDPETGRTQRHGRDGGWQDVVVGVPAPPTAGQGETVIQGRGGGMRATRMSAAARGAAEAEAVEDLVLYAMRKLEIVIEGEQAPQVRDLFRGAKVSGYTMIRDVAGMGHHGFHEGRLLFNDTASLVMFVVVLPDPAATALLLKALRPLLARHSGVVFVSEVGVMRPGYFATD
jgi:nitrogen regulatory protein PII